MASISNQGLGTDSGAISRRTYWISWVLSGLVIAFLVMDGAMKLVPLQPVIDTLTQLGYSPDIARPLGILLLICTLLYAIPRTSLLGAVLLTGYLGGAMATHVRIGSPLFTHILFGFYLSLFIWGGLYLRDTKLRALFPIRR
jgi:hypothetical protein